MLFEYRKSETNGTRRSTKTFSVEVQKQLEKKLQGVSAYDCVTEMLNHQKMVFTIRQSYGITVQMEQEF